VGEREVYQKRSFLTHQGTPLLASHTIPILRRKSCVDIDRAVPDPVR
jgi:hypothetical protein